MFTAYYILAVSFGVIMALISLYAIKFRSKDGDDFPGKLYGPLMILGGFFMVATLAAVIHGGKEEVKHRKHEEQQKAHEAKAGASLPATPAGVVLVKRA